MCQSRSGTNCNYDVFISYYQGRIVLVEITYYCCFFDICAGGKIE